jgi:hypothetical protein
MAFRKAIACLTSGAAARLGCLLGCRRGGDFESRRRKDGRRQLEYSYNIVDFGPCV